MIFARWHPEVAIRYLPIVREIRRLGEPSVLEIGSGGLGIAPYLGRKVVGMDTKFTPPFHPLLEIKIGDATKIPFPDKSFDVVICVDTLEHMENAKRKIAIEEMLRVAKKEIIIAVPTGAEAARQDQKLSEKYKRENGQDYDFLTDHEKFGLPTEEEIKHLLGDNVRTENNEPLILRNFLMRGWMQNNIFAKIFFWKILLLTIPLFNIFNQPPYYRTIFYEKL